jgi:hypothetical protein
MAPLLLLLAFIVLACREDMERSYRTYDEAVADGAITRGWLPVWLPPNSTDIYEWHDLDSNASFASFTYGSAAPETFLSSCEARARSTVPPQPRLPHAEAVRFYRCIEHTTFAEDHIEPRVSWVAVDNSQRRAYFWR